MNPTFEAPPDRPIAEPEAEDGTTADDHRNDQESSPPGPLMFKGYCAELVFGHDCVVIDRKGMGAKLAGKHREIPLGAVSDVLVREPTIMKNGHLQFVLGDDAPMPSTPSDPNTVLFTFQQRRRMIEAVAHVRAIIAHNVASGIDPASVEFERETSPSSRFQERKQEIIAARTVSQTSFKKTVRAMGGVPGVRDGKNIMLVADVGGIQFGQQRAATWDQVQAIHVDGPDEITARFTATRLIGLGPLGLAFKKSKRRAETFITIETTHAGTAILEIDRARPVEIRSELLGVMNAYMSAPVALDPATAAAAATAPSTPLDQIRQLAELRDAGALTDDEFAAKKAELLERL